jgi:hypothetical protein
MKTQRIQLERNNRVLVEAFNNGSLAVLPAERAGPRIKPRCEENPSNRGKGKATVVSSLVRATTDSSGRRAPTLCSQPISHHGAGTVWPWAAVNPTIAQGRHNVSARDGGLPASRRTGAGAFLCALLRPLPRMHLPQSCRCIHSSSHTHRPADAVVPVAGDPPIIHGPAAAAGPTSFYTTANAPLKSKISNSTRGLSRH